jgi:hypothetical protein
MTGNIATSAACPCLTKGPRHPNDRLERQLGVDETEGRFASVRLTRCLACGRLWLGYHVEYEAITGSGRWATSPIGDNEAVAITPETAAAYIHAAPFHVSGGSYWGTAGRVGRGHLHWGL